MLRPAGLSVSHMQVARWRNQGWRPVAQKDHPLEAARKSLDDAMPLLRGNPSTTANVFVEKKTAEREALEQLTDKELLNQAVREIATTAIIISCASSPSCFALLPCRLVLSLLASGKPRICHLKTASGRTEALGRAVDHRLEDRLSTVIGRG